MLSPEQVIERINAGIPIEQVAREMLGPDLERALDRCAWVRAFDRGAFSALGAGDDEQFEQVLRHPDVRPVPGSEGRYRLRAAARQARLKRLAGDHVVAELRNVSGTLAASFHDQGRELDELDQLIAARPADGLRRLRSLYRDADEPFRPARCQALIDVVHDRADVRDPELRNEGNRLERYLTARLFWRDHYRRTTRFLLPHRSEAAFERLLSGETRTLQLFATGGMGKTMHLQALIARRAVPDPPRLACSLLDFDLVQVGNVLRHPWLLLVEVAFQLNQQLGEPVFDAFLVQHTKHLGRLLTHTDELAPTGQLTLDQGDELERVGDIVRDEFFSVLERLEAGAPALLVFDTFEKITHREGVLAAGDPARLLDELQSLRTRLPHARLVFSGRYDLRKEIDDLQGRFGPVETLKLGRLTKPEASTYLRRRRKLRAERPVLDAAIESAGSAGKGALPFRLAVIADAIAEEPGITADRVRALREPGLNYVIERVIERIDDVQLRYLLRYAVVPRLLTREFVIEVLARYLPPGVRGTSPYDDPSRDPDGVESFRRTDPKADVDLDALWRRLSRYASAYSWVSPAGRDALRVHPDVIDPLRELLRAQPVFPELNRAAIAFFESKAEADPRGRPKHLREALFHRAVLDGAEALETWRATARGPGVEPAVAAALADEVIEMGAVFGPGVVAEARVERAIASLRIATAPGAARGSELWDRVREDVGQARLSAEAGGPRLAAAQAALFVHDGDAERAIELVQHALSRPLEPGDRLILHVRHGDALALQCSPDADAHYAAAIDLATSLGVRPQDVATLHWKRAIALDRSDDVGAAAAVCEQGMAVAPQGSAAEAVLAVLRGWMDIRLGAPSASERWTEVPLAYGDRPAHEAEQLLILAELAAWRPERALVVAERAVEAAARARGRSAEAGARLAEAREWRGVVRARLLDFVGALEDLEAAGQVWDQLSGEGARRCQTLIAEIHMREMNDYDRAELALVRAANVMGDESVVDKLTVVLRQAELNVAFGRPQHDRYVDEVLDELARRSLPARVTARVALDGLALAPERRWLDALTRALETVRPVSARLALLDGIERCRSVPADGAERLAHLLDAEDEMVLAARDRCVQLVRLADVARLARRGEEARRLVERAAKVEPGADEGTYARRQLVAAAVRVGAPDVVEDVGKLALTDPAPVAFPALSAALLIELAERLLDSPLVQQLLKFAAELLRDAGALIGPWLQRLEEAQLNAGTVVVVEQEPGPEPVERRPAALRLTLTLDGERLSVEGERPAGPSSTLRHGPEHPLVAALLRGEPAAAFSDARAAGAAVGTLLLGPEAAREPEGDIVIATAQLALEQVPWELARRPADGRLLATPPASLRRELARPVRGPAACERVLLVHPQERSRLEYRGAVRTTLHGVEERYAELELRVEVIDSVEPRALTRSIKDFRPDVVHIMGRLVDAGGGSAIDISSGRAGEYDVLELDGERLTSTGLGVALGDLAPIVVIDPPALSRGASLAVQLLLRNAFAAELARFAALPAIVAIGLVSYRAQDNLYSALLGDLAAGAPLEAAVARARALGEAEDSVDAFGLPAIALWT